MARRPALLSRWWLAAALGCAVPGPSALEKAVHQLVRQTQTVAIAPGPPNHRSQANRPADPNDPDPLDDLDASEKLEVSFLRAGDPSHRRVVFLHGTPGKAAGWADYMVDLPQGLEAVAIDRPGFGETQPATALPSLADQARVVKGFLVSRGDRRAIVVGHSLGAAIAVQTAVDYPAAVGGLVLLAGALDPDSERVLWIQRVGRWRAVEWLLPRWARNANRELIDLELHLRKLAPRLWELRCPVVIVHGTDDPLVPYSNVAFLQAGLARNPWVEVNRLEGQNHFLPWNSQAAVRQSLVRAVALADALRAELTP